MRKPKLEINRISQAKPRRRERTNKMKTCVFCGHETDELSCPRCKEYKGLVDPKEEREFTKEQERIIKKLEAEAEQEE